MSDYNDLVDRLMACADNEDDTRLTIGEVSHLLRTHYGDTGLKQASIDTHMAYTTLAERRRVVEYYQGESAGQIAVGGSVARELLAEFPVLRWTHLRVAKGLSRDDPGVALDALYRAIDEAMTVKQFKRYIARIKIENGQKPTRMVFRKAGYTVTITDSLAGREHRVERKDGDE